MPGMSRRNAESGTENAFVVPADIPFGSCVPGEGASLKEFRRALGAGATRP